MQSAVGTLGLPNLLHIQLGPCFPTKQQFPDGISANATSAVACSNSSRWRPLSQSSGSSNSTRLQEGGLWAAARR